MRYTISEISEIMSKSEEFMNVRMGGWVETKNILTPFSFNLVIKDGSCFKSLIVICDENNFINKNEFANIRNVTVGNSVFLKGNINRQKNLIVTSGKLIGLTEKKLEEYSELQHFRMRTKFYQGIALIRNTLQFETHNFFNKLGFINVSSPILTSINCEGNGDTFDVVKNGKDYFNKKVNLSVSGQFHLESYAHSFTNVYSFGPTFRAESDKSEKHLSEFWMIEPEMSFIVFSELMDNMEMYLKYVCSKLLKKHMDILIYFDKINENGLVRKLEEVAKVENKFLRKSYEECVKFLWKEIECGNIIIGKENRRMANGILVLDKRPELGKYFGDEYGQLIEKYLIEEFGNKPFFMTDFPKNIKPFYAKNDRSNMQLVEACDLLVPRIGELMGGSMREDDYGKLKERMDECKIEEKGLEWYTELRKNGTVPHGGYGIGFERLICYVTGMKNIIDVIPFYRTNGSCFG